MRYSTPSLTPPPRRCHPPFAPPTSCCYPGLGLGLRAVHEVASHRRGWAVSLHGGVSGGIRGGVLQGCHAQGGLGPNEGGGGSAIPR